MMSILYTNNIKAQVKFGPVAGVNFTDVTGDINTDGMLIGFHFGALVNFGITHYLMFEPQVLYAMRGAKGKGDNLDLNYIEIPMWLRYQVNSGLNFNVGPYAGILVSAKVGDDSIKDNYKTFDFGLGGGIGYQLNGGLGFAINYSQGLVNIIDSSNLKGTNTCIKISLSYTFGGKRE